MPNDNNDKLKRKEAYEMAQSMDEQIQGAQDDSKLNRFLNIIGQIESSGGKDFSHEEIKEGIHEGHRAAGTYGLMPNTVKEIGRRAQHQGTQKPIFEEIQDLPPEEIKSLLESDPATEREFAERLAERTLDRFGGDESQAAYGWFQGHNLTPEEIEDEYEEHPYTKKYQRFKEMLQQKNPKLSGRD